MSKEGASVTPQRFPAMTPNPILNVYSHWVLLGLKWGQASQTLFPSGHSHGDVFLRQGSQLLLL